MHIRNTKTSFSTQFIAVAFALVSALWVPIGAHAAALTEGGKKELTAVYFALTGQTPTTEKLNELIVQRENGASVTQIATTVSASPEFLAQYPSSMNDDALANKLTQILLGDTTPQANKDYATNWTLTMLQSGKSRAQIIAEAVQSIWTTTATEYAAARLRLVTLTVTQGAGTTTTTSTPVANQVASTTPAQPPTVPNAVPLIAAEPFTMPSKEAMAHVVENLVGLAEDFKIEEEDNTAVYQKIKASLPGGTSTSSPAAAFLAQVQQLQKDLKASNEGTDMKELFTQLTTLVSTSNTVQTAAGGSWGGNGSMPMAPNQNTTNVIQNFLTNEIVNGKACRNQYNTTTHSYVTVCN